MKFRNGKTFHCDRTKVFETEINLKITADKQIPWNYLLKERKHSNNIRKENVQ